MGGTMLRVRQWEWLDARPLWQFVVIELAISTAILLVVGELLYRLTHSGFDQLSPVFYVIWLAVMTPFYIWLGRRRDA
jgi:hypothetical protein